MAGWFLLALVFGLQGYCSAVHKGNETILTKNGTTHVKPTHVKHSLSILPFANCNLTSPEIAVPDSLTAVQNYTTPSSKPPSKNTFSSSKYPLTTNKTTPTFEIAVESKFESATTPDVSSSRRPVRTEIKTSSPSSITSVPMSSAFKSTADVATSNQKAHTHENIHPQTEETNSKNDSEIHRNTSEITFSMVRRTHTIQIYSTSHEKPTFATETLTEAGTSTVETTDSSTELETSTSEITDNSEESQISTFTTTEIVESTDVDTDEFTTENYSENLSTEITKTDPNIDLTTTEFATEKQTGDFGIAEASIPNGVFPHLNHPLLRSSSPLARLVLKLSKPGVFGKGKSVFEDDVGTETTSCPPGDVGLTCRRAEARRGADECSGGNCEECRSCDDMAAIDWPHCCRENFRCCSELALACQQCNEPTLQVFCTKHFKRCF